MPGEWQFDAGRALRTVQETVRRRDELTQQLEHVDAELTKAVADARQAGVPWEMLTSVVGVSRQAMSKRIARYEGHRP